MSSQQPRMTIEKPVRANGVLLVPASATQRESRQSSGTSAVKTAAAPATRQKILIRRLPPGLTQAEFEEALGEEWRPGGDRVGWTSYKPGKVSRDPAKPSRPTRAYLYVKNAENVGALGEKVRITTFNDAKHSGSDSCLLGPPSAEFAPFQKTPNTRPRKDARQSTIDQDPEFIDFLESLTTPIAKSSTVDQEYESTKIKEKITVTPLIQFLRDRKANKGKEASEKAKASKHGRQDSKGSKAAANANTKTVSVVANPTSTKKRSAQGSKAEQTTRDNVKIVSKPNTSTSSPTSPSTSTKTAKAQSNSITPNITPNSTANAVLADKKRERGTASAAAKILQRDLGLAASSPGGRGGRGARGSRSGNAVSSQQQVIPKKEQTVTQATPPSKEKAISTATERAATISEPDSASAMNPTASTSPTNSSSTTTTEKSRSPPSGPAASRANPPIHHRHAHSSNNASTTTSQSTPNTPSNSTQAFLKHANPSQGITEALLSATFNPFGDIKKCEIDKKKGFAYIDFESPESLQKAIKASPVKVAQGQVVVLERKIGGREQPGRNAGNSSGGGGGSGSMGRGGGAVGARGGGNGGGPSMMARGSKAGGARGGNARGRGGGTNRGGAGSTPTGPSSAAAASNVSSPPSTPAPTVPAQAAVEKFASSPSSVSAPDN